MVLSSRLLAYNALLDPPPWDVPEKSDGAVSSGLLLAQLKLQGLASNLTG
jgi:hypothetical protein